MTPATLDEKDRELAVLRARVAADSTRIQDAQREARRKVMEHATYDHATRTYYITDMTLAHWGLK